MLKKEICVMCIVSNLILSFLVFLSVLNSFLPVYFILTLPAYFFIIYENKKREQRRERVSDAVLCCLETNELEVLDNVEMLRMYFKDTKDVIDYLSNVDSRLLAYVFDEINTKLNYKDFIQGGITCLSYYMGFTGVCSLSIENNNLIGKDKISPLLSILYLTSRQISNGAKNVYVYSKSIKDRIIIDVVDQDNNHLDSDFFVAKLCKIFSRDNIYLSRNHL